MKSLNPNSMIQGRYLIVQPIGKGGMGEVYLAVDQRLGSAVALKRTFFSEDSALGSAFEREARILGRLRHPVLPKVIDHFAENGDQFLVMEHISGDDIAKRLEVANKPFPLSWVMFWADQMLDALAYLHSHEPPIVHRDIKPQNLKLTDDNHIVLLDFGLSKDFDSNSSGGLNSASVAGYSPHFASMEQIRGTGTDARSDLYSLAATLYQMLANVVPPDALTRADSMLGGKGDPIRPLNELNPEVSPAVSDVLIKAVAIRQDERFSTAVEMQKEMRRAFNKGKSDIDAKPVMGGSPSDLPVTIKPTTDPKQPSPIVSIPDVPELETQIRLDSPVPMDATLQMSRPPQDDDKQSELKTAVFRVETLPTAEQPEIAAEPEIVVPPIEAATAAAAGAAQTASPNVPRNAANIPVKSVRGEGGQNKSKAGLIVGIVAALGLLVVAAGGAGWYLMDRSNSATTSTPTPVPANTATPPTVPAISSSTNQTPAATSNANVEMGSETNVNTSNSATTTSVPTTRTNSTGTTKTAANKPSQAPPTKVAPKTKAKDDRTVILQ